MSAYQEDLNPSCPKAMSTDGWAESNTLRVLREVVHGDPYHRQFMPLLDEIDRLRAENAALRAAVERVRAACENDIRWVDAQPILRALEETP